MGSEVYQFGDFTLNPAKRTLFNGQAEVKLRDKDFDVLLFLLANAPDPCSFDEIIQAVWGKTNVENGSVEKAVANIRKSLADDARSPRFIKTVRTKGYLFFGDLRRAAAVAPEESVGRADDPAPEKTEVGDQSRHTSRLNNQNFRRALWGAAFALLAVSGLLLWKGLDTGDGAGGRVIFADDFSGEAVNPGRWRIKGRSVKLYGGTIKLSVDETDNPGILRSDFFSLDPNRPVMIESRLRVDYSRNMKDKVYFGGLFGLIPKTARLEGISILEDSEEVNSVFVGVRYMNYDSSVSYNDPQGRHYQDIETEGFFLVRDGGRPNTKAEYAEGKISPRIQPVWGEWFEQKIIYNPADGLLAYFVDGEKRGEFFVGGLKAKDSQVRFEIIPWGWWVNHSIEIDYIRVTQ